MRPRLLFFSLLFSITHKAPCAFCSEFIAEADEKKPPQTHLENQNDQKLGLPEPQENSTIYKNKPRILILTPGQEKKLLELVDQYAKDWERIAKVMKKWLFKQKFSLEKVLFKRVKDRAKEAPKIITAEIVKNYYKARLQITPQKKWEKFTPEEDKKILEGVQECGTNKWMEISQRLPGRSPISIRNRYYSKYFKKPHLRRPPSKNQ